MPTTSRLDASSFESLQLELLRAQLADAKEDEMAATKALTDSQAMGATTISGVMSAAKLARDRPTLTAQQWNSGR
jgi:subtilisin-like proprotein convertase family protein